MSKKQDLALGFGGPTLLMSDGDAANNIKGYAIQAIEDCVFSQLDLDMQTNLSLERKLVIQSVNNADNSFTLLPLDWNSLEEGDKIYYNHGGVDIPQGTIQDSEGRATELKDQSIYFVQAKGSSNKITIEEQVGAGGITISDDGTLYGNNTYFAKLSDQNFSYGTFTRNASANDRTHEIAGSTDGRIFKTYDDSGLQVNMFDTTGGANVGDVQLLKGMTVYLPITDITLTTGACIVYTK
tara:strand:- start:985 stop:1701 length:717 start_codon:yes stop_codon:yes gene_type:complete